ncbi:hypothetical protein Tco_1234675 [Tanacetum coccineum]
MPYLSVRWCHTGRYELALRLDRCFIYNGPFAEVWLSILDLKPALNRPAEECFDTLPVYWNCIRPHAAAVPVDSSPFIRAPGFWFASLLSTPASVNSPFYVACLQQRSSLSTLKSRLRHGTLMEILCVRPALPMRDGATEILTPMSILFLHLDSYVPSPLNRWGMRLKVLYGLLL